VTIAAAVFLAACSGGDGTDEPAGRQIWSPGRITVSSDAMFWASNSSGVTPASSAIRYHESPAAAV